MNVVEAEFAIVEEDEVPGVEVVAVSEILLKNHIEFGSGFLGVLYPDQRLGCR